MTDMTRQGDYYVTCDDCATIWKGEQVRCRKCGSETSMIFLAVKDVARYASQYHLTLVGKA